MKVNWKIALPLCVGLIGGAAIVQGLHAQTQSPVLYIVDISEVVNAEAFKAVSGRSNQVAGDRVKVLGGRYVARTDSITAIDGTPPKRMIIIAFDSMEKAKAYQNDPSQKDIDANRMKNTKSRVFWPKACNRIDAAGDGRRVGGLLYLPSHLCLARLAPGSMSGLPES